MANYTFYLTNKKKENSTLVLYCRWDNLTLKHFPGISVQTKYWNQEKNLLKETEYYPEAETLNETLKELLKEVKEQFNQLRRELKRNPTYSEYETAIKGKSIEQKAKEVEKLDFIGFYKQHIAKKEAEFKAKGSESGYLHCLSLPLKIILEMTGREKIPFEDINDQFYTEFVNYCTFVKNYRPNTIGKAIMTLRGIMRITLHKLHENDSFQNFTATKEESFAVAFSDVELEAIKRLELTGRNAKLEQTRDIFYIACKIGLRCSDWPKLPKLDLTGDYFHVMTKKTQKRIVIPISESVKEILRKYDYKLPKPKSNNTLNDHIRQLGKLAGLTEKIEIMFIKGGKRCIIEREKWELGSTHTARRSFATNLYLKGAPLLEIMKITGHTSEAMLLRYIKLSNEDAAKRIKVFLD